MSLYIWPKRNGSIRQKSEFVDGLPVREGSTSLWKLALAKSLLDKGKVLQESGGGSVQQQVLPIVQETNGGQGRSLIYRQVADCDFCLSADLVSEQIRFMLPPDNFANKPMTQSLQQMGFFS